MFTSDTSGYVKSQSWSVTYGFQKFISNLFRWWIISSYYYYYYYYYYY